ncbi:MAG: ATP-binding cassette domain-containing protein [Candidatus Rokubacteria bacterium]|nr:ATP-binding cassette domain-containing protein [Candidatus Rokubacteria bacterium]
MSSLLEARDLVKHFPLKGIRAWLSAMGGGARPAVRAVDGISLRLAPGETLGLVGESGCGKSTVARCLLRLIEPSAGRILFDRTDLSALPDEPLRRLRRDLQMVFQDPNASLNPRLTVRRTVDEPLRLHTTLTTAERQDAVREVLDRVGLGPELLHRYPHELSGGQRQRVNIARAIATRPRFVILDEPTSALDVSLRAKIILLLDDLRTRLGMTYLFISHDLATVKYLAHRVAVMYLGTIVEEAPTRELFSKPLHPYTRALLSAIPIPDPDAKRERLILAGEVPSPIDIPTGCRLRTRCPLAQPVCAEPVGLREVTPNHFVACHLV